MAPMWFSFGLVFYFCVLRLVDYVQKKVAKECDFDCSKCSCHCAGYHCYCERVERAKRSSVVSSDCDPGSDS